MRYFLLVSAALVSLSACVRVDLYHKSGTSLSRLQSDETRCKVEALRQVPVDRMTRVIPPRTLPRQICNAAGECRVVYVDIGGRVETYDANLELRQRVEAQCMADKGYRQTELTLCTGPTPTTLPATMAPIGQGSCAVKTKTGYRAYTPG